MHAADHHLRSTELSLKRQELWRNLTGVIPGIIVTLILGLSGHWLLNKKNYNDLTLADRDFSLKANLAEREFEYKTELATAEFCYKVVSEALARNRNDDQRLGTEVKLIGEMSRIRSRCSGDLTEVHERIREAPAAASSQGSTPTSAVLSSSGSAESPTEPISPPPPNVRSKANHAAWLGVRPQDEFLQAPRL